MNYVKQNHGAEKELSDIRFCHDIVFCNVYTYDFSDRRTEYSDFETEITDNEHSFISSENRCIKINVLNGENKSVYVRSGRVKKCGIRFKIKCKNPSFLVHNETVLDFSESGIYDNLSSGKSTYFLCVKNGGEFYNFANLLPCKFNSYFQYEKKGVNVFIDFITEFPATFEGEFRSETLLFANGNTCFALKDFIKEDKKEFEKPVGWSTWDYYFTDINEDCVKENVDFIARDEVLSKNIKYIAIDDGWEHREGDWKEGATFPNGLEKIVEYINKKGFIAGIWTCPVRINVLCATVMRRHDFLIKDEYGDPILYDGFYVLDPTHPDGEKFIRETFTYLYLCGFRFYKIDFIGHILAGERFYDKSAGPFDAIRKLLAVIRECVGNSHILGCNMPYGVGNGYVDSRRVGLDIHNTFGHVVKCGEIFLPQFAASERVYRNDLDYTVVRGEETSIKDEFNVLNPTAGFWRVHTPEKFVWRYGKDFSYTEAKTWCAFELINGSSVFLGDRLKKLNADGLKLIYTVLKYADFVGGEPVDIFEKPLPSVWKKPNATAVFNWSNENSSVIVEGLAYKEYRDVFTDKIYRTEQGRLTVSLLPHDCLYLVKENSF